MSQTHPPTDSRKGVCVQITAPPACTLASSQHPAPDEPPLLVQGVPIEAGGPNVSHAHALWRRLSQQATIKASVDMIRKKGFAPRYINFLRQICGSYERPMPNNQVGPCRMRGAMSHAAVWEPSTWLLQTSQTSQTSQTRHLGPRPPHAAAGRLPGRCHAQELDGVCPTFRQAIVTNACHYLRYWTRLERGD